MGGEAEAWAPVGGECSIQVGSDGGQASVGAEGHPSLGEGLGVKCLAGKFRVGLPGQRWLFGLAASSLPHLGVILANGHESNAPSQAGEVK